MPRKGATRTGNFIRTEERLESENGPYSDLLNDTTSGVAQKLVACSVSRTRYASKAGDSTLSPVP